MFVYAYKIREFNLLGVEYVNINRFKIGLELIDYFGSFYQKE